MKLKDLNRLLGNSTAGASKASANRGSVLPTIVQLNNLNTKDLNSAVKALYQLSKQREYRLNKSNYADKSLALEKLANNTKNIRTARNFNDMNKNQLLKMANIYLKFLESKTSTVSGIKAIEKQFREAVGDTKSKTGKSFSDYSAKTQANYWKLVETMRDMGITNAIFGQVSTDEEQTIVYEFWAHQRYKNKNWSNMSPDELEDLVRDYFGMSLSASEKASRTDLRNATMSADEMAAMGFSLGGSKAAASRARHNK